eukprot:Unigene3474_Nuclearia_a/m.10639 Unigene3474_Nuclearia_a/g.10639  ORF Unigene3474_Nuclearia_a/g.10639 Unigene3474_Nuclearia_a/m.10639 type:complete len:269 (-) Unigene3474_Nuclearia_a:34-840(-)
MAFLSGRLLQPQPQPAFNVGDVSITQEAFASLRPGDYVMDLIFAYWAQRLSRLSARLRVEGTERRLVDFVAPSLVQLVHLVADEDVVRDALGPLLTAPPRFLVLPVNDSTDMHSFVSGSHWSVLACDLIKQKCVYYDSYLNQGSPNCEAARDIGRTVARLLAWTESNPKIVLARVSQQRNGSDCGPYSMIVMETIYESLQRPARGTFRRVLDYELPRRVETDADAATRLRVRLRSLIVHDAQAEIDSRVVQARETEAATARARPPVSV